MATAAVGIISIGDMGAGIARLLLAHNFRVLSNVTGRSQATQLRAQNAQIELLPTDEDLVAQSDYILSIVPPRDAKETASRIISAYKLGLRPPTEPLYFVDLNAIAPSTARSLASAFASSAPEIRFIDGGIIGGPPRLLDPASDPDSQTQGPWYRPGICLSGPHALSAAPKAGPSLAELLNTRHVGLDVGTASGLKCCFASMTKGATALAIQSFSTAARLGVLGALQDYVGASAPARLEATKKSLVGFPPKAGRWVEEMREIGKTFGEEGGWSGGENVFERVAEVYEFVAEETVLGEEHVDRRKRGKTLEDVVEAVNEGIEKRG